MELTIEQEEHIKREVEEMKAIYLYLNKNLLLKGISNLSYDNVVLGIYLKGI